MVISQVKPYHAPAENSQIINQNQQVQMSQSKNYQTNQYTTINKVVNI